MKRTVIVYGIEDIIEMVAAAAKKFDIDLKKTTVSEFLLELGGEEEDDDE
ncbi:MAG: hypothetical protein WC947_04245 [Elusimicrobiota bacterium]